MKARYNTSNDIRDRIDLYKDKMQKLLNSAAALDMKAAEFFKAGPTFREDAIWHQEEAKKKRKQAGRIRDNTLGTLKSKMAEFQTEIMPDIITDGDRSIPVSCRKTRPVRNKEEEK